MDKSGVPTGSDVTQKDKSRDATPDSDVSGSDDVSSASSGWLGFMGSVYQTVRTHIAPAAVDFVTTQVAPRALYVMKRVLQDVPGFDLAYSDSEDDWHECKFEESEEDGEDFEDADEQLQPRDRIHHICHELMTTEQSYVERLGILVMAKQRTMKISEEASKNMFKDIQVIHQFHKENLLPELQHRLQYWEQHNRIGDIMRKLTPFLKLYTEYVKNFQTATTLVDHWEEKSGDFRKLMKEIREDSKTGRLRIQAHMLEPVQRVPRYELLLRDYLKRLPEDSPDKEDTTRALEQVSEAAKHFEEMMKRDSRIMTLVELQSQLEGSVSIVNSTRELIRKGRVRTINAKNSKSSDRMCFLFNDLLLIADHNSSRLSTKYKVKHIIDITTAQIADGNNIDIPHTFYIKTRDMVVEICLRNGEEKVEWEKAITKQIGGCTKKKLLRTGSRRVKDIKAEGQTLGRQAPVLVHQSSMSACMICNSSFGALKKKKHCRACGHVVCAKCSGHSILLHYDLSKPVRVCDECFVILEDKVSSSSSPKLIRKMTQDGECVEKGYLQLSSDGGRTWKKRWFTLHDNLTLHTFKATGENALTTMSLSGYSLSLEVSPIKRGNCIRLHGMGKIHFLYDDDPNLVKRWFESVTKLVEKPSRDSIISQESTDSFDLMSSGNPPDMMPPGNPPDMTSSGNPPDITSSGNPPDNESHDSADTETNETVTNGVKDSPNGNQNKQL